MGSRPSPEGSPRGREGVQGGNGLPFVCPRHRGRDATGAPRARRLRVRGIHPASLPAREGVVTMTEIYLDNNATTRPLPAVIDAVVAALRDQWGNPSSGHLCGERA